MLDGGSQAHTHRSDRDWLGNRWETGASKINIMLLDGAILEQMRQARGEVRKHLADLRGHMGLPVVCAGGIWRFDRNAL